MAFYKSTTRIHSILVTEFLAGGDLLERTSAPNYVLTEEKCRNIVRQITRGVQFIHSRRFIHLDLKPFNIVFSKKRDDFDLRIIDFGLARELGEAKSVRTGMCGYGECFLECLVWQEGYQLCRFRRDSHFGLECRSGRCKVLTSSQSRDMDHSLVSVSSTMAIPVMFFIFPGQSNTCHLK